MVSSKHRIDALDGLRGLAVALVVLNHLHLGLLYTYVPAWLSPVVGLVISNGKLGVAVLFLLSGFLMATIYQVIPSAFDFWQKRYTRIFPAFVVMCISLAVIRWQWNHFTILTASALIMVSMIIGGVLWRRIQQSQQRGILAKRIFSGFLILQIITVIGYIILQVRVPSAVYYIVWPAVASNAVNTLVNMTMTIPFGTYVGELDGAYWALIAEVSFYLFYPVLFLPAVQIMKKVKSPGFAFFAAMLALPFCYGLSVLFQNIAFFSLLQIHLMIYFIAGMVIGSFGDTPLMKRFHSILLSLPKGIVLCIAIVSLLVGSFIPFNTVVKNLLSVFPVSLAFVIALNSRTLWASALSAPLLRRLGIMGYSLYLTHTIAIELVSRYWEPATFLQLIAYNLGTVMLIMVFASFLHVTMEFPYFHKTKALAVQDQHPSKIFTVTVSTRFLMASIALIVLVWYGYKIPASFATLAVNTKNQSLPQEIPISSKPVTIPFVAKYDNLGILTIAVRPLSKEEMVRFGYTPGKNVYGNLTAKVTDGIGRIVNTTLYPLYQIYDSKFFMIGLPVEEHSAGKEYRLQLSTQESGVPSFLALENNSVTVRQIYMVNKTELFKSLPLAAKVLWNKFSLPFSESEPWIVLFCCLPICITMATLSYQEIPNVRLK
jgi:peptidoglycan/LPS O-acetylase OafA/YrhL